MARPRPSPGARERQRQRLPGWTWPIVVLGGVMSYVGVAVLLHGHHLYSDLVGIEADAAA